MLDNSGESEHICLMPDFEEKMDINIWHDIRHIKTLTTMKKIEAINLCGKL